jgi:sugar fermentation stimulation protein A
VKEGYVYDYGEFGLEGGVIEGREKRFLAYCRLDGGEEVVAHCVNPGSMKGVLEDLPQRVWLSRVDSAKAKLKWRLEIVESKDGVGVGVHTTLANRLVESALNQGLIPELSGYDVLRREVKYGVSSRIDFLLERGGDRVYVEVKSVTMCRGKEHGDYGLMAEFPDGKTSRGLRHLEELWSVTQDGFRGVVLYVVQRGDCGCVGIAGDIDRDFEEGMRKYGEKKIDSCPLEVLCYGCEVGVDGIRWGKRLPLILSSKD